MWTRKHAVLVLMVALIAAAVSVQAARLPEKPIGKAPRYDVQVIGDAIYYSSVLVNNAGTVMANWGTDLPWDELTHGYVAGKEHTANLDPETWVTDINNRGIICGQKDGAACYWTKTLRPVLLFDPSIPGFPPGADTSCFPRAISDNNVIVGDVYYGGQPFVYDGAIRILSTDSGSAYAVNSAGLIGGYISEDVFNGYGFHVVFHPVLWVNSKEGYRQTALPLPVGATGGYVSGLNDSGDAVGAWTVANGFDRAAIWRRNATTGEYEVECLPASGYFSYACAINSRGQIVGRGEAGACLWDKGAVYDLNDLLTPDSGCSLYEATGMNEAGQISCLASCQATGEMAAVLLTPVGNK